MRLMFVVEVKTVEGLFFPEIGFGKIDTLLTWMSDHLHEEMEIYAANWRIVKYVPEDREESVIN